MPVDNTEYVYFIQAGRTQAFKIGKSDDPQGRLDSLQTANPHKLKLVHTFKADNASTADEELHRLLHSQRMAGEWFNVSKVQQQVIDSIQQFEQGQFWIGDDGVELNELFVQDRYGLCLMMVEVGKMKLVAATSGGGGETMSKTRELNVVGRLRFN